MIVETFLGLCGTSEPGRDFYVFLSQCLANFGSILEGFGGLGPSLDPFWGPWYVFWRKKNYQTQIKNLMEKKHPGDAEDAANGGPGPLRTINPGTKWT